MGLLWTAVKAVVVVALVAVVVLAVLGWVDRAKRFARRAYGLFGSSPRDAPHWGPSARAREEHVSERREEGPKSKTGASACGSGGDRDQWGPLKFVGEYVLLPWILSVCQQYNPALSGYQVLQLTQMFRGILTAWKNGQNVRPLFQATVALAVPNAALAYAAFQHILQRTQSSHRTSVDHDHDHDDGEDKDCHNAGVGAPRSSIDGGAVAVAQEVGKSDEAVRLLRAELSQVYGCKADGLASILDPAVLRALVAALRKEPVCPITLDPLVDPRSGRIEPDVAMLCQSDDHAAVHAFLYRKTALDQWFSSKASEPPTNPLTRQRVDPARDFVVLS